LYLITYSGDTSRDDVLERILQFAALLLVKNYSEGHAKTMKGIKGVLEIDKSFNGNSSIYIKY
jgi:hypothetical protein